MGIKNFSWLKRFQKLSCKEHVLESFKKSYQTNKLIYNKQRNFCVSLQKKEKKEYFAKLNEKDITYNKKFWHTVKPFLSDKVKSRETITLVNNENIESNENEVTKSFNNFFSNIVKNIKIRECQCEDDLHNRLSSHRVLQTILKYSNFPKH